MSEDTTTQRQTHEDCDPTIPPWELIELGITLEIADVKVTVAEWRGIPEEFGGAILFQDNHPEVGPSTFLLVDPDLWSIDPVRITVWAMRWLTANADSARRDSDSIADDASPSEQSLHSGDGDSDGHVSEGRG